MNIWDEIQTMEDFEEFKRQLLDLDSSFNFKCRKCGKCCKNQNEILFSPRDIFRIAQKLEQSPLEILKSCTEIYIGQQSRIPVVHLLMQGQKNACPFLSEHNLCSIHDVKPFVCALYPLGRVMTYETIDSPAVKENAVRYVMSINCGSAKKRHTVRKWLAEFGIPENDEFFFYGPK